MPSNEAVQRARTEVERRRRLRSMADRETVVLTSRDVEIAGRDEDAAGHLRAAALGELRDRPAGTKPLILTEQPGA